MLRALAPLLLVAGARGFASTPPTDTTALEGEIAALRAELAAKEAALAELEDKTFCTTDETPTSEPYEGFTAGASIYKYANGETRRPTDPATADEIIAVQALLFGSSPATTLGAADALLPAWAPITNALGAIGGIDPATVDGVSAFEDCPADALSGGDAGTTYQAMAAEDPAAAAAAVLANSTLRCNLQLWSISRVATIVPDRDHVVAVDAAVDAGETGFEFKKIVAIRLSGGMRTVDENGAHWKSTVSIGVDVTDVIAPFVVPEYLEMYLDGDRKVPSPSTADVDAGYMKAATMAIFNKPITVHTMPGPSLASDIKQFAQPYKWLYGDGAQVYGATKDTYLVQDSVGNALQETVLPLDTYTFVSAGNLMGPYPMTLLYEIDADGAIIPSSENTLLDSDAIGLCWYGRGLTFSANDSQTLADNIDFGFFGMGSNWAVITPIFSAAISEAWGDEEIVAGSGFYPGVLVTDADGLLRPKSAVDHKQEVGTYSPHATPTAFSEQTFSYPFDGMSGLPPHNLDWSEGIKRDARHNLDKMAPPVDAAGEGIYKPNGKPKVTVEPAGASYTLDGYGLTYSAGITWKADIGFDPDAGLMLYNIRVVLPPSKAYPEGEVVPYLFKAGVANFGTAYSSSNHGAYNSPAFLESHFADASSTTTPKVCSGQTLPVYKSRNPGPYDVGTSEPLYSTLFPDGNMPVGPDPYLSGYMGIGNVGWNGMMYAKPANVWIPEWVCLEESINAGKGMWHMSAAQDKRSLLISQTTITEAYNIILDFELMSTGQMKVGQHAHGQPLSQGGAAPIPGVNGQFASEGQGGFACNHLHWSTIVLEPMVRGNGAKQVLQASDLATSDEPSDWFGKGFYRRITNVTAADQAELMQYDWDKQRFWILGAYEDGKEVGGLKITSGEIGVRVKPGNQEGLVEQDADTTFAGNHWWLSKQDVFVFNATGKLNGTNLIQGQGKIGPPSLAYNDRTTHPMLQGGVDPTLDDQTVVWLTTKLYHDVLTDEMPTQNGFSTIDVKIEPHNLFGFNPNILARYDNSWTDFLMDPPYQMVGSTADPYPVPYDSQFDLTGAPAEPMCAKAE